MTPYRVLTPRLELRCWEPRDAAALKEAIDESQEHLARWLEWARVPPQPLDAYVALCRRYRGLFDLDQEHHFAVVERGGGAEGVAGGVAIHGGEVGYWIRASRTRRGLAVEAVSAVCRVALLRFGLERVLARVHRDNRSSLAVLARVGFVMDAIGDDLRFALVRAPAIALEAYDAVGRPLSRT